MQLLEEQFQGNARLKLGDYEYSINVPRRSKGSQSTQVSKAVSQVMNNGKR